MGANLVNRRALEAFNIEKSFGAQRTSTLRTFLTLDGIFESLDGELVALGEGLTESTPSGTEVSSEAGLDIFVGESWGYAGARRSASRDKVGT
jgi:hypothetical protein